MKNLLTIFALLCLLASCSADSDFNSSAINSVNLENSENVQIGPGNILNPFDKAGILYYNTLIDYQNNKQMPNSVGEITEQIKFISGRIDKKTKSEKRIIVFNDSIVESIMADPDNCMINIVQSSQLSSYAKGNLINFLQGLINQRQLDFTVSYNYIVDYEGTVIDDTSLDADETETILTITSISRYSLYSETERKDKDWDLSAGNKPARKIFSQNEISIISIIALLHNIL
ncbi:MAG: hypothetical protein REI96_13130 [Flavobacterium nitrogenifigens]|uniref:hypothetical protein n=1 Tax=Flavobacterium nitrogenifigens TaxID=1617283 RepID=UPI002809A121|nr:hypothetical protein [Flavobacterium nitrogenifigens]MDQ8013387.1 hypothetical protein [Flavobacterium nitrogenifigens]